MIKENLISRILVLSPHIDDGEFGCGGSIAKFIEKNKEIYYVAFSLGEKSAPHEFRKNELEIEVKKATKVLGIKEKNLHLYRYEVRRLASYRQEILEELVRIKKEIKPNLVFLPSPNDLHQDHQTISNEGLRAFKNSTILAYELPWNNISFNTLSFIILNEDHIKKKIEAIKCYNSQRYRYYVNEDFIKAWVMMRGIQIGCKYAETFEVLRWIIE